MYGSRHQFFARPRFAQQQDRGLRRGHACHQFHHALEGRCAANESLRRRFATCNLQPDHFFGEKSLLPCCIEHRCEFDVDVFLSTRRVMQMQHTLALTRGFGPVERTRLARLVARDVEMVRHRITRAPHHTAAHGRKLLAVRLVGRHDAVLPVKQNVRLGQTVEIGRQFGRGKFRGHLQRISSNGWQGRKLPICHRTGSLSCHF